MIGDFQPYKRVNGRRVAAGDLLKGYFPAVVPEHIFYQVQVKIQRNQAIYEGGKVAKEGVLAKPFQTSSHILSSAGTVAIPCNTFQRVNVATYCAVGYKENWVATTCRYGIRNLKS